MRRILTAKDQWAYFKQSGTWQIKDLVPSDISFLEPNQEEGENPEFKSYPNRPKFFEEDAPEPTGWYHVSPHQFQPGDKVVPRGGPATDPDYYAPGEDWDPDDGLEPYDNSNRQNYVWMSNNLNSAMNWSSDLHAPYIYKIHPGDHPQPWNMSGRDGWVAPDARIIGPVPQEEIWRQRRRNNGYED